MKTVMPMIYFTNLIMINMGIWNKNENKFANMFITFDTGASVTTISNEILEKLGYDSTSGITKRITTASSVNYVKSINIDKIMIGDLEIDNIEVFAHVFPSESFSFGVLGLNVLSMFDVNLIFSRKLIEFSH